MISKLKNSPMTFGLGNLAIMLPSTAFSLFYTYYYVDKLGLPLFMFALARTIYVGWDALIQPVSGYLSDRTRTKWGRRKPWIISGIPFYAIFFVLLYSVPGIAPGWGLFVWFLAFQLLSETVMAILSVNYLALFPEIFSDGKTRARVSVIQQIFYIVALLIGTAVTPLLYDSIGYSGMAMVYAIAFIVLMVICVLFVKENPEASAEEPLGMREAFSVTLSNRPFWWFNISLTFSAAVVGLVSASIAFYAKYVLHLEGPMVSVLMLSTFVSVIPMALLWYFVVRRFGALPAYKISVVVFAVTVVPLFFARNLLGGILAGIVLSIGLAGHFVIPQLVQSQIIDKDAVRTGRRREGIYMAVSNFVVRTSALLTAISFWLVGTFFGYVSGDNPGPDAQTTFIVLTSAIPLVLLVISLAFSVMIRNSDVLPEADSADSPAAELDSQELPAAVR